LLRITHCPCIPQESNPYRAALESAARIARAAGLSQPDLPPPNAMILEESFFKNQMPTDFQADSCTFIGTI
jgi:hypothetical protein